MILVTTSKAPTQRINSFVKDLRHSLPAVKVVRRGKTGMEELPDRLRAEGCDRLLVVGRRHGAPGRIDLYTLKNDNLIAHDPTIFLREVRLRREYDVVGRFQARGITRQSAPSLSRIAEALSEFFQLPEAEPTELSVSLHISRSDHGSLRISLTNPPSIREVGPSMSVERVLWSRSRTPS